MSLTILDILLELFPFATNLALGLCGGFKLASVHYQVNSSFHAVEYYCLTSLIATSMAPISSMTRTGTMRAQATAEI